MKAGSRSAFTLIELAVVLVIIGLVVGGILTGRSLIEASGIQSQISQLQTYNTAAQTFKGKYEYWPGDLPTASALRFGLGARSGAWGYGNGDGQVNAGNAAGCCNLYYGELAGFWLDLTATKLIGESFNTAVNSWTTASDIGVTLVGKYIPEAKIGGGNFVYVWSDGVYSGAWQFVGKSYFGISKVTALNGSSNYGCPASSLGLSVNQAYAIDQKLDDGLPDMGKVIALHVNGQGPRWATTSTIASGWAHRTEAVAVSSSATSCYDNGGSSSRVKNYTLSNGNSVNCAVSYRFIE